MQRVSLTLSASSSSSTLVRSQHRRDQTPVPPPVSTAQPVPATTSQHTVAITNQHTEAITNQHTVAIINQQSAHRTHHQSAHSSHHQSAHGSHHQLQSPASAASPANIESSIELPQGCWHTYLSSQRSCAVGPRSRVLIDSQQLRTVASLCNIVRSLLRQLHESPLDMLRLHQARSRAKGQLSARPASCGRYLRSPETGLAPRGRVSSLSKARAPDIWCIVSVWAVKCQKLIP